MKGPLDRTKVVLRHLPPTISQSNLVDHIDSRFSGRYHWLAFRPGKSSLKHLQYARAYIDFDKPDDVIEFAEFFKGHVFVNEKGTQFRTIVEYAPSQRVPKQWSKKDGREGTILKDPEYLEFLEFLAKPVENLPSAEIQLERKEAERAGAPKEAPVVTPLMDFVRQKRAAKGGARRSVLNGKPARRVAGMSSRNPVPGSLKRGSEKRTSTAMRITSQALNLNWTLMDDNTFLEQFIDVEIEAEKLLLGRHELVEIDRMRNGNREALTALRKRAKTTQTSVPSPFESLMRDIDPRPLVKEVCTTCGHHNARENMLLMFPGTDTFATIPFHAAHTILEEDQARLDFDSKKLQSFVKEQSLIISEKGALSDKIGPGVLKSLVNLTDKPKTEQRD